MAVVRRALQVALACAALLVFPGPFARAAPAVRDSALVLRVPLHDTIGPASRALVLRALDDAESRAADAVVFELDTPGGLDDSMRDIVKRMLAAEVPVVVYVAPSGSRAASAGFFILIAAHVAAMAPGTSTGAAHPVQMSGAAPDPTLAAKIENDAASFARALAQKRDRNPVWAERAVRESASLSAPDALAEGVIDRIADDLPALLAVIDSLPVETLSGSRLLHTQPARVETMEATWRDGILSTLANPNVAYLLLMLGTMGLLMELWNPGALFPGIIGAIALLLAFFALQVLPVSQAGLLLLLVGVVLLVLEIKVTSYGALALGGVAALTLGSILLFESPGDWARVSVAVLVPTVAVVAAFFLFVLGAGVRAQRRRPVTGPEGMAGATGRAESALDPLGRVFLQGEFWDARATEPVPPGALVVVLGVEGSRLVVRPVPGGIPPDTPSEGGASCRSRSS